MQIKRSALASSIQRCKRYYSRACFTWIIQDDIIVCDEILAYCYLFEFISNLCRLPLNVLTQSTLAGIPPFHLIRDELIGILGLILVLLFHGSAIFERLTHQTLKAKQIDLTTQSPVPPLKSAAPLPPSLN